MSYQVKYTDIFNPAKPAIVVEDQTLNSVTSVKFPGKNYAGYAPVIAENFLHLLENFARNTAPGTQSGDGQPVEGQLWYDNAAAVNILKVYDGTTWSPVGGVKRAADTPSVSNSTQGDLWVNTTTQQLYVFSGSSWLLIGPQFSSGLKTGPMVESIVGTDNQEYSVLSLYSQDYRIAIVSRSSFTPKQTINGFPKIEQGMNLSAVDAASSTAPTKFWGIAEKAESLIVAGNTVNASEFLSINKENTINYGVNIRNNSGITIGSDLSFAISTDTNKTLLYSKTSGNSIQLQVNNAGIPTTAVHIDSTLRVGIGANNTNPTEALDVAGNISSDGKLIVLDNTDAASVGTASISTVGGLSVNKKSILNGDVSAYGKIYVNNLNSLSTPIAGATILPGSAAADSLYDIGLPEVRDSNNVITQPRRQFRNVYAQNFIGNFNGEFTGSLSGSISGSAAKLASPTVFSLTGDVSSNTVAFDGQSSTGTAIFTTTISQDVINNRLSATVNDVHPNGTPNSLATDMFLIYRDTVGLRKVAKSTIISNIPTVPVGSVFAFAGTVVPNGYLLCDGGEVKMADYPALFEAIRYTYKPANALIGQGTFALPDLRGRFALGRDNMDNGNQVPSITSGLPVNAGGGSANRVTDVAADTIGAGAGNEQRTIAVTNLPDHKHTLATSQADYFAIGRPGLTTDTNGVPTPGPTATSTGLSVPNTGSVIPPGSSTLGQPLATMNPYMTINYIIFTGAIQ